MIAEVIIDSRAKNLNRVFDYKIPKDLEDVIDVGSRVLVPFANFKALEQGYVIKLKQSSEYEVKEIAGLEDNLSKERIELACYMARKYFCNVSECIKLMVTPGTRNKQKKVQDKKMNPRTPRGILRIVCCAQSPPKRRERRLNSMMAASRSSRVKSGHRTSISTSSE